MSGFAHFWAEGDFITRFDGRRLDDNATALADVVRGSSVGHQALLEVRRDTSTLILQPVLSENKNTMITR